VDSIAEPVLIAPLGLRQRSGPITLAATAICVIVAACGGDSKVATPLPSAPEPAVSPAPQSQLPGTVLPLAGAPEGIAIIRSSTVAVAVRDPNQVVLFDLSRPSVRRTVALTGSARHLFLGGPDGPLLIPQESDNRFVALSLPGGQMLESVAVGRQPHDSIAVGPDTVFVADELADTIHIVRNGAVSRVVGAPLQPGGMASAPAGSVMVTVDGSPPTARTARSSARPTAAPAPPMPSREAMASTGSSTPTAAPSWASALMTTGPTRLRVFLWALDPTASPTTNGAPRCGSPSPPPIRWSACI